MRSRVFIRLAMIHSRALTVMASRDVDGGAARLIHRWRGRRVSERPADLRDTEWLRRLEPMIPRPQRGGRPRKTDTRAEVNCIS
jgi:hypothetical protein